MKEEEEEESEVKRHLKHVLQCFVTETAQPSEERETKGQEEVWKSINPARTEVEELLEMLPEVDICTILENTVANAYKSMAALGSAANVESKAAALSAKCVGEEYTNPYVVSLMLQVHLETGARLEGKESCLESICNSKVAVESWKCGNVSVSLMILRSCEAALLALLDSSVKALLGGCAGTEEGIDVERVFKDSHDGMCLVSCCQRAPDITAKVKLSLAHWIRESKSVTLWKCFEMLSGQIVNESNQFHLQYPRRYQDFVSARESFLNAKKGDYSFVHTCSTLKELFENGCGKEEEMTQFVVTLMESRRFLALLMMDSCSRDGVPASQQHAVKALCRRAVCCILQWIHCEPDTETFFSFWSQAFAARGRNSEIGPLIDRFSDAILSLDVSD